MKIHSDVLTASAVRLAARETRELDMQDIYADEVRACGSRSRRNGIILYAESMHGKRARNGRDGRAASWTAYGYLIARLFVMDPKAIVGQYKSVDDFRATCARYVPKGESLDFLEIL